MFFIPSYKNPSFSDFPQDFHIGFPSRFPMISFFSQRATHGGWPCWWPPSPTATRTKSLPQRCAKRRKAPTNPATSWRKNMLGAMDNKGGYKWGLLDKRASILWENRTVCVSLSIRIPIFCGNFLGCEWRYMEIYVTSYIQFCLWKMIILGWNWSCLGQPIFRSEAMWFLATNNGIIMKHGWGHLVKLNA